MGLHEVGGGLHHLGKLQDSQVVASALGVHQGLVVFFHILADHIQDGGPPLDLLQIIVRPVAVGL